MICARLVYALYFIDYINDLACSKIERMIYNFNKIICS